MDRKLRENYRNPRTVNNANVADSEQHKASLVYSLINEKRINQGTYRVGPSSALLEAKKFLPLLKEANSKLQENILEPLNKDKFNIEHVDELNEHIEMELAIYPESDDSDTSYFEAENSSCGTFSSISKQDKETPPSNKKSNLIQEIDMEK